MSQWRNDLITKYLSYTDTSTPSYQDKYWQVQHMLHAFNENMANKFSSLWVMCLHESMPIRHNKFICPGWLYCPCKPHPYDVNEYHTACQAKSNILFSLELVEGKDCPLQLTTEFDNIGGKTIFVLCMLKSYFATGKYIVLDSGFCILKGIDKLRKRGLFACALIKIALLANPGARWCNGTAFSCWVAGGICWCNFRHNGQCTLHSLGHEGAGLCHQNDGFRRCTASGWCLQVDNQELEWREITMLVFSPSC